MRFDEGKHFRVGLILKPHGVRGALKLQSLSFDESRFNALSDAYIESDSILSPIKVTGAQVSSDSVIVKIDGVNTRDDAERLRGKYICVDRKNAAKLPEGQYYVTDLLTCSVFDSNDKYLGDMDDVYSSPANDVYEVLDKENGVRLVVPALKILIKSVDIENRRIVFDADVLESVGYYVREKKSES